MLRLGCGSGPTAAHPACPLALRRASRRLAQGRSRLSSCCALPGGEPPKQAGDAFFNRVKEIKSLQAILAESPRNVLVLLGPPSCGKSAVLDQLRALSTLPKPTIVDMRASDYLSPQTFAENLLECMENDWELSGESLLKLIPSKLAPWQALWKAVSRSVKFSVAGAEVALDIKQRLREDPTPLITITSAYTKLALEAKERRKPGDPWPVIVIDEANRLSSWKDKDALEQLLAFFVFLTKQKHLAHVILATSDTFLLKWLENGPIKAPFSKTYTMGDLSREEARTFFFDHVLSSKEAPGASEAWDRVYEVCGGNPGALCNCAVNALTMDWDKACDALVRRATKDILSGLKPQVWKGAAWSTEQFGNMLRAITSSPHAAVPVSELEEQLGAGSEAALESMNEQNLLLRRSFEDDARDIDPAAFGPLCDDDVYMLPSAAHLLAARRRLSRLS